MTRETGTAPSRQVIGVDPIWTPPVPLFTDSFSTPIPTSTGVVETDPAACAAWPTTESPESSPLPDVPPFQVVADWSFVRPFYSGLLSACLTVQNVMPRTCVGTA